MELTESQQLEKAILADIETKTGLSFVKVGGIPTRDKAVADAVLPVLVKWAESVDIPNGRLGIYHRFGTPHAYPFIDKLIRWWEEETDPLCINMLGVILSRILKQREAERVWAFCRRNAGRRRDFMLLTKLATFPTVAAEVKEELVRALDESQPIGDLEIISKVDDPHIREWFIARVHSTNTDLRNVARRVVARGKKVPREVQLPAAPPDRSTEIYSTEIDLEELGPILKQFERELGVKIPRALQSVGFLASLDVDRWIMVPTRSKAEEPLEIWLRLEDIDTVEVAVTRASVSNASPK
jgi:hypothetical protein